MGLGDCLTYHQEGTENTILSRLWGTEFLAQGDNLTAEVSLGVAWGSIRGREQPDRW